MVETKKKRGYSPGVNQAGTYRSVIQLHVVYHENSLECYVMPIFMVSAAAKRHEELTHEGFGLTTC